MAKAKKTKPREYYRWRITQIAKKGRYLGTIKTDTDLEEDARRKAEEFFKVDKERLMAQLIVES